MPQSLSKIWLHLVFSTKERRAYFQHENFRQEMFRMLAHRVKETGCVSGAVGGWIDHVHLLVGLSRTICVADLVKDIKIESSKWAKKGVGGSETFSWQSGYGVFSVSHSNRDEVYRYIQTQEGRHQTRSFQDEFRELCRRHDLEWDEAYVWD